MRVSALRTVYQKDAQLSVWSHGKSNGFMSTRGQFFTSQNIAHPAEINPARETRTSPARAQWAEKESFMNSFYLFSVLPRHR